ncbi:MAG: bifunctional riboflavin kinase/FAD synthetase [Acidobacteria bacterium]|nr:bifunctional riboflavin kinase/FAD synthetase [Acidobacteriota bacterium]
MIVINSLKSAQTERKRFVITIGNYDGLHRGHKKIIRKVIARARETGGASAIITFEPHPRFLLHPESAPPLLLTREEKIDILSHWGLDYYIEIEFNYEFSQIKAMDFLKSVWHFLTPSEVYVGEDFRFGLKREGDCGLIKSFAKEHNSYAEGIEKLVISGEEVSSTMIRKCILEGDVEKAHFLLGRPFEIRGIVEGGAKRGREIGFATANLKVGDKIVPKRGVYSTLVDIKEDALLPSVSNIGIRPTFSDIEKEILEIHIIDREIDLYGKEIRCLFIEKIRDEKRFSSLSELRRQIEIDKNHAKEKLLSSKLLKRKLFWG